MFPRPSDNPIDIFTKWYEQAAQATNIKQHDAVNLATVSADNIPSSRMVLLKDFSQDGFIFYTNFNSKKSADLETNPNASLCFFWQELGKQIRITGTTQKIENNQADEYFASRPRQSKIGAWASKQSQPLENTAQLLKQVAKYNLKFGTEEIPRPPFWGGYIVKPTIIEFWQLGEFRIHKRLEFTLNTDNKWSAQALYP